MRSTHTTALMAAALLGMSSAGLGSAYVIRPESEIWGRRSSFAGGGTFQRGRHKSGPNPAGTKLLKKAAKGTLTKCGIR